MSFIQSHLADAVAPPAAHREKIAALLDNLPVPNEEVYGHQGSAALAPGFNLYAYAHHFGFTPASVADRQRTFVGEEKDWRGLGVTAGPLQPDYAVEPIHFRVDQHLVIAETHPDAGTRKLALKQAAESVSLLLASPLCVPNAPFTNPRGYGWGMDGLRNWWIATADPAAATGWATCMGKLKTSNNVTVGGEPYLTLHPAGADHGLKSVSVWMTGRAAFAVAHGVRDSGGYGKDAGMDAVADRALACLVYAEKQGKAATGLSGRLVDDYLPGPWLNPLTAHKFGTMSRWAYPAALELARAGVPGADVFLDGPIRDAFLADDQMRPINWKVGNGWGSMHVAGLACFMAPRFGFRA